MNIKPGCQSYQQGFLYLKDKNALQYEKEKAVWWGLLLFGVCVCMRSLGCGVELLMVHLLCANSVCLDPWMQLQLRVFAFVVIYFIIACTLTKEKSSELPLISCSIAPLGQNAWANIVLKRLSREFNAPLLLWNFWIIWGGGGYMGGSLFRCCSTACMCLLRVQHVRNVAFPKQSYQKEQDRTAIMLHYKSSGPRNDTAH